MAYPTQPSKEHPSTYIVQDRTNLEELDRLELQDAMLNALMGGVLPEQPDPTGLHKVLDVGCGTAGWLIETAQTYPMIEQLVGVDVSSTVIAYARAKVDAQNLQQRVVFQTTDALRIIQFPAATFDLVNQRLGVSWLREWEWKKLLVEYSRVLRAGGIVRLTESGFPTSNSPAFQKLCEIGRKAFYNSKRFLTEGSDGITPHLVPLLEQHAFENVQTRTHTLKFRPGDEHLETFYKDIVYGFRLCLPFLQRWTRLPADHMQIYHQALAEMRQPGFEATWMLVTAWGTKQWYGEPLLLRGLR
jgi:ubiquinone/menaquinone biosynthesis C-methylase UbiE